MTHVQVENLAADYLDERLDPLQRAQWEEHLATCESCKENIASVRLAIQACRSAAHVLPPAGLALKIQIATLGERPKGLPNWREVILSFVQQPRLAHIIAMMVFSVSLLFNVAGISLRKLTWSELNPATWVYRANRAGHLFYARTEKLLDDSRVVYEFQSRFGKVVDQLPVDPNISRKRALTRESPESEINTEQLTVAFKAPDAAHLDNWEPQRRAL